LFLKNGAGGVHDQLWQKTPVEETKETLNLDFSSCALVLLVLRDAYRALKRDRVDYRATLSENK
jgi:hypothetical protein